MKTRSGNADDATDIAALIASFRHELTDHPGGAGAEHYFAAVSVQAERTYLTSERYRYTVAEFEGKIRGFIALQDFGHVFHLFVDTRFQRTGIARRLWQESKVQALANAGVRHFTVNSSLRAVPVYRSFGFEDAGEIVSVHGISFLPMRLSHAD